LAQFREELVSSMGDGDRISWEKLRNSIISSVQKVCGTTRGQKRQERDTWWWREDVQEAVRGKKESFESWQGNRNDETVWKKYKAISRQTKRIAAKAKHEA